MGNPKKSQKFTLKINEWKVRTFNNLGKLSWKTVQGTNIWLKGVLIMKKPKQTQIKFSKFKCHTSCTWQYPIYTRAWDSYNRWIDMKERKIKNNWRKLTDIIIQGSWRKREKIYFKSMQIRISEWKEGRPSLIDDGVIHSVLALDYLQWLRDLWWFSETTTNDCYATRQKI